MLVLVLEFSRISATTLHPRGQNHPSGSIAGERPEWASPRSMSLLQNGRREPELRKVHLTGIISPKAFEHSPMGRLRTRVTSIQLGSCLPLLGRCAP